jgi:hypothetical protein
MRTTLALGLIFTCALAVAQDETPARFESKEGNYSVQFPGKPAKSTRKAGGVDLHIAIVEKGTGGFAVIHTDLPAEAVRAAKPKDLLDGGQRKGLVESFKAKVTSARDFEFGPEKHPARELVAEKDQFHLRVRMILAGNRLYQVLVVGPRELTASKDADSFFKSFDIAK